jgi:hypothetical protein
MWQARHQDELEQLLVHDRLGPDLKAKRLLMHEEGEPSRPRPMQNLLPLLSQADSLIDVFLR